MRCCFQMVFFLVLPIFLLTSFLVFTDYPKGGLSQDIHTWLNKRPTELQDVRYVLSEVHSAAVSLGSDLWEQGGRLAARLQAAYKTGYKPSGSAERKMYEMYTVAFERLKPVCDVVQAAACRAWDALQLVAARIQTTFQQKFPFLEPWETVSHKDQTTTAEAKGKQKKAQVEVPVFAGVEKSANGPGETAKGAEKSANTPKESARGPEKSANGPGKSTRGPEKSAKDHGQSAEGPEESATGPGEFVREQAKESQQVKEGNAPDKRDSKNGKEGKSSNKSDMKGGKTVDKKGRLEDGKDQPKSRNGQDKTGKSLRT